MSVSEKSEQLCFVDKGKCIFFFQCSGVLEGAQFLVCLICLEMLHMVCKSSFDLWDLLVSHGVAFQSLTVDHIIFSFCFECFTWILSLSLIFRLSALALHIPG